MRVKGIDTHVLYEDHDKPYFPFFSKNKIILKFNLARNSQLTYPSSQIILTSFEEVVNFQK